MAKRSISLEEQFKQIAKNLYVSAFEKRKKYKFQGLALKFHKGKPLTGEQLENEVSKYLVSEDLNKEIEKLFDGYRFDFDESKYPEVLKDPNFYKVFWDYDRLTLIGIAGVKVYDKMRKCNKIYMIRTHFCITNEGLKWVKTFNILYGSSSIHFDDPHSNTYGIDKLMTKEEAFKRCVENSYEGVHDTYLVAVDEKDILDREKEEIEQEVADKLKTMLINSIKEISEETIEGVNNRYSEFSKNENDVKNILDSL